MCVCVSLCVCVFYFGSEIVFEAVRCFREYVYIYI